MTDEEMSIRDQFAIHCPDAWLRNNIPATIGPIKDLMVKEGIISSNVYGELYTQDQYNKLVCLYRWKYADMMMSLRGV